MTLPEGITDVAPGKLATVVTYLQMLERPAPRNLARPEGVELILHPAPEVGWYRDLYRRVGQEYLWFSRLVMEADRLAAHLASGQVEVWSLRKGGADLGLLELEWLQDGACELSFFGLAAELTGGGIGRWLMEQALERAFSRPITRFFVHTCTLDSAQALGFYIRSGFVPDGRAVEIADDPRLTGLVPQACAPQVPLLR